ncbi:uncharacterized protein LOC122456459 [Dermochelys coriacea]|uniref:uncharacterized protein LOC122456459 n=1 Tax=Dermochelys coriacea TaxID=27794 RepID=UPI001CA91CC0|nr:uncharacterized protein LOC122456459 [Dermochelys coriacea]
MGTSLILRFFIVTLCPGAVLGESIQSNKPEVSARVGDKVTLSCSYNTSYSDVYLYWYRQFPDQGPQYVLRTGAKVYSSVSDFAEFAKKRFTPQADDTSTVVTITALELADTAVYLCALQRAQRQSLMPELCKNPPFLHIKLLPLSTCLLTPSENSSRSERHDLPSQKPCGLLPNNLCSSMCLTILFFTIVSTNLPGTDVRLTGLSLPGSPLDSFLNIGVALAIFQSPSLYHFVPPISSNQA